MNDNEAVAALGALAQCSRLAAFRALVVAGPQGLAAGVIAERLGIPPTSLSFHLKELMHAGLILHRSQGRYQIYSADFESMNRLLRFLTENCCGGAPCATDEVCSDNTVNSSTCATPPVKKAKAARKAPLL